MKFVKVKLHLEPDELPSGFSYPLEFFKFLEEYIADQDQFDPWGLTTDPEMNQTYSDEFGQPLVQFAQAWLEDMIACFVIDGCCEPSVVVFNPWAKRVVDGKDEQFCMLLEEFPSFTAWLDWMRDSELVRNHAEARAGHAGDKGDSSVGRPR